MSTTTLNRLIELLGRATEFYTKGTASGSHSTTTLQDSSADSEIDALDTKVVSGKWLRITSTTDDGAPVGEVRKISSVSTSTVTVDTAFSAAPADGDTYEILSYHPSVLIDALQQAIRQAYPDLYKPLKDESLIVDNLLSNVDFASFSGGAFTSWSSKGTPSLSQETQNGATFARITASGATEGLEQDIIDLLNYFESAHEKTLHVRGWLRCNTASSARLRVTFDGSTYTNGAWHSGSGLWEFMDDLTANITSGATEATVSLEVEDGVTGDFDLITAWVGPLSSYTLPSDFIIAPTKVLIQADIRKPAGPYIPLAAGCARPGHILRLEGKAPLSVPTAPTGTTEVDERQAELLVAKAASVLHQRLIVTDESRERYHEGRVAYWNARAETLRLMPGVRSPRTGAALPKGGWTVNADSSNRYLELPR
jgi:hypothetical protein